MDFGTLLHTAQKNEKDVRKEGSRFYSTKFEPPKKEQRNKQQLSVNIKKFLAKKEAEEKEKKLEADRKREMLLALRAKDKKATRRVNVMLKRTKSANQSVIQDAVDTNNTSVTLAGAIQPDEDDYGYVSQEAAAYYNKMMEKYSSMPEEPKFNSSKKKVSMDLQSTRERVKAAIEHEKEEANMPHRRKKRQREQAKVEDEPVSLEVAVSKKPKVQAPPPLNFNDLLKLAAKKQHEPIIIEQKPKEEERLFTKKQKKEIEREREWRERKEGKLPPSDGNSKVVLKANNDFKVPKVTNNIKKKEETLTKIEELPKKISSKPVKKVIVPSHPTRPVDSSKSLKSKDIERNREITINKDSYSKKIPSNPYSKHSQLPDLKSKPHSQKDLKPKKIPMPVIRKNNIEKKVNKRRILDDDEEYDSEMDDFIDDGPEESEDYSKYISEIFGYDKSKYRHADDDIDNMESTFAQQMREEVISTKIGIMEDLEDMKKEEEEKRQKALLKKRRKI